MDDNDDQHNQWMICNDDQHRRQIPDVERQALELGQRRKGCIGNPSCSDPADNHHDHDDVDDHDNDHDDHDNVHCQWEFARKH